MLFNRFKRRRRLHCRTSSELSDMVDKYNKPKTYDQSIMDNSYFTINNLLYIDHKEIELINDLMDTDRPFFITNIHGQIIYASYMWAYVYNCDIQKILGKSFNIFQNNLTDKEECHNFKENLRRDDKAEMTIINTTLDKKENLRIKLFSKRLNKTKEDYVRETYFNPYYLGIVKEWSVL